MFCFRDVVRSASHRSSRRLGIDLSKLEDLSLLHTVGDVLTWFKQLKGSVPCLLKTPVNCNESLPSQNKEKMIVCVGQCSELTVNPNKCFHLHWLDLCSDSRKAEPKWKFMDAEQNVVECSDDT